MALTDRDMRNLANTKQGSIEFRGKPSVRGMLNGQIAIERQSNSQLALYRKQYGKLWKSYMSHDGNEYVDKNLKVNGNLIINNRTGIGVISPEGSISISSGYHKIAVEQNIRYAHSGDNTVIVELSGVKIPANSIITNVVAVVRTASNLSTHLVNIQMSATSGTSADTSISSGTELLGAGVSNTDSTDSASAQDIDLKNDPKEVWICRDTVRNGGSDQYIYICNAGTSNGTTNSTSGNLTVIIDYYGMD
jgi:hypothetical protein